MNGRSSCQRRVTGIRDPKPAAIDRSASPTRLGNSVRQFRTTRKSSPGRIVGTRNRWPSRVTSYGRNCQPCLSPVGNSPRGTPRVVPVAGSMLAAMDVESRSPVEKAQKA